MPPDGQKLSTNQPIVFIALIYSNMFQDTWFKCLFFNQSSFFHHPPTLTLGSLDFDNTKLLREERSNINIMAIINFSWFFYNGMT